MTKRKTCYTKKVFNCTSSTLVYSFCKDDGPHLPVDSIDINEGEMLASILYGSLLQTPFATVIRQSSAQ